MNHGDREAGVLAAVVSIIDNLMQDFDVVELLTELTERCAQLLDVSSAGLLLSGPGRRLHLMAATSDRTEELELFQLQADEGPCMDCFASGEPVSVADLDSVVTRWPSFVPAAREAGFASVHAVPMRAAGQVLGALGLFGTRTGALNADDLLVGRSLAHVATVAIVQGAAPRSDTVLPNLQSALVSRVVVEQAKGFVHERLDVSMADAFTLLRRHARESGDHLTALARRLMSDPQARPEIVAGLTRLHTDQGADRTG